MAKKATAKTSGKTRRGSSSKSTKARPKSRALVERRVSEGGRRSSDAGDAFIKLLQSPLVAELVAVAATAALAALAEQGFTSSSASRRSRAGTAVKAAGKAAAAAVGRRLSTEVEEIRKASNASKASARG